MRCYVRECADKIIQGGTKFARLKLTKSKLENYYARGISDDCVALRQVVSFKLSAYVCHTFHN